MRETEFHYLRYLAELPALQSVLQIGGAANSLLTVTNRRAMTHVLPPAAAQSWARSGIDSNIARSIAAADLIFFCPDVVDQLSSVELNRIITDVCERRKRSSRLAIHAIRKPDKRQLFSRYFLRLPFPEYKAVARGESNFRKIEASLDSSWKIYTVLDTDQALAVVTECLHDSAHLNRPASSLFSRIVSTTGKALIRLSPGSAWEFQRLYIGPGVARDACCNYLRMTGRLFTDIRSDASGKRILRIDGGSGSAQREECVIRALSAGVAGRYMIPPVRSFQSMGHHVVEYPYLSGRAAVEREKHKVMTDCREFLKLVADHSDPDAIQLESAALRFGRYIEQSRHRISETLGATLKQYVVELDRAGVFRFVTHGEFRTGNMFFAKTRSGSQLKIVDWPQAYKGHPLLDWWMFLYWSGAPRQFEQADLPDDLRLGISEEAAVKLWSLWRHLYNRN